MDSNRECANPLAKASCGFSIRRALAAVMNLDDDERALLVFDSPGESADQAACRGAMKQA